jgi:hypothetical protein
MNLELWRAETKSSANPALPTFHVVKRETVVGASTNRIIDRHGCGLSIPSNDLKMRRERRSPSIRRCQISSRRGTSANSASFRATP